jgi:tetratricopeptide (TPR) repeat protein
MTPTHSSLAFISGRKRWPLVSFVLAVILVVTLLALQNSNASAQAQEQRGVEPRPQTDEAEFSNGNYYALVIGIDEYRLPMRKLNTAANDARAVAKVLSDRYGFQVKLLLDGDATRFNILDTLSQYRQKLNINDNLLIYYAGHGYSDHDTDKAYWLPFDADSGASANRIIADDLTADVRGMPSRHVLIISDSCYSGGLSRDTDEPAQAGGQPAFLRKMLKSRSRTLMASGGDEPVSDNGTDGHSVFAYALLWALEQTNETMFTAGDLFYSYIRKQVAGKSSQLPQYSIIRNSNNDEGDFVFTLKVAPSPPSPDAKRMVENSRPPTAAAAPAVEVPSPRSADLQLEVELELWRSIKDAQKPELFEDYLRQYPEGHYAMVARARSLELRTPSAPASTVNQPPPSAGPELNAPSLPAQEERWKDLNAQVNQLVQAGKYSEAITPAQESLRLAGVTFGAQDPNLATSLSNLALLYYYQHRYADAEPLYKRALVIQEKAFGPDHPLVATSLSNLAALYDDQGHYAEAEPLYQRVLVIQEKAFGSDNPHVAESLNNLALVYEEQGRYAQAEPLYKRALAIREKALGPEDTNAATSLSNLAALYYYQGRYAEAEPIYQRALAIQEKAFGPDHPEVAKSLNNLAALYDKQGRYAEAEPLYRRALAIQEKAFGPDHPEVASSLSNLALLYEKQGRYAEAELLYKRALEIREKALGPDHPLVVTSLNNLAALYDKQGRHAEAEQLYKRARAIRTPG